MLEVDSRLRLGCMPNQWVDELRKRKYVVTPMSNNSILISTQDGGHKLHVEYIQRGRHVTEMVWYVRWDRGPNSRLKSIGELHCAVEDWMWLQEEYDELEEKMNDRLNELVLVVPKLQRSGRPTGYTQYGYSFLEVLGEGYSHSAYAYPVLWFSQWKARPWSLRMPGVEKRGYYRNARTRSYKHVKSMIKGIKGIIRAQP